MTHVRLGRLAIGAAVGVAVLAVAGLLLVRGVGFGPDSVTAVAVADLPEPGADAAGRYRYTTEGYESVDALGGTRHDYPAETVLSVSAPDGAGCLTLRWTPFEERSDEFVVCVGADGSFTMPRYTNVHEFFGRTDRRAYVCDPALQFPPDGTVADGRCAAGKVVQTFRMEARDEAVTIGGRPVAARRVRLDGPVSGGAVKRGQTRIELWLRADGLPLRLASSARTTSPQIVGDVHFEEEYDLRLVAASR